MGGGGKEETIRRREEKSISKPEADVIKGLVINAIGLVGVLHQLMNGEGGVVRLHHGVRHLGRGHHGVGVHDPVGVFLADLGDKECAQAGSGAAAQRVGQLEPLIEEKTSVILNSSRLEL
jgi:hypothetical protein